MKTKLNLTINSDLVPRTKKYANKRGKSLSQLVEDLLINVIKEDTVSFSSKWSGKLKVSEQKDERTKLLKKRYQL